MSKCSGGCVHRLTKCVLTALVVVGTCLEASAQVRPEDQLRTKKSDNWRLNTLVAYRFASDFADQESPRRFLNSLRLSPFFNYKRWNLSVASSLQYTSVGQEIEASQDDQEFFFQDIELSANYAIWTDSNNSLAPYAIAVAPNSQRSQDLGIQGVYGLGAFANSRFFQNRLIIANDLMAYGIANSFYFSPLTGNVNQSGGTSYNLGLAVRLSRHVLLASTTGARLNQFVDGSNSFSFRSLTRLNISYKSWIVYAYYLNGSYPDQTDFELWYLDEYRQVAGAGITYVF
jgi:hypothetical protein